MNKDYDTIGPIDEITIDNSDLSTITIDSNASDFFSDLMTSPISTMNSTLGGLTSGPGSYTITNGASTSAGSTYQWPSITTGITTGTTGILSSGITDTITLADYSNTKQVLQVRGDAEFDGDVKIKGISLADTLEQINSRLAILQPNPDLESRWGELRELRERYQQLERELTDKEKVWNTLKD